MKNDSNTKWYNNIYNLSGIEKNKNSGQCFKKYYGGTSKTPVQKIQFKNLKLPTGRSTKVTILFFNVSAIRKKL